jgi:hypothetical protein
MLCFVDDARYFLMPCHEQPCDAVINCRKIPKTIVGIGAIDNQTALRVCPNMPAVSVKTYFRAAGIDFVIHHVTHSVVDALLSTLLHMLSTTNCVARKINRKSRVFSGANGGVKNWVNWVANWVVENT